MMWLVWMICSLRATPAPPFDICALKYPTWQEIKRLDVCGTGQDQDQDQDECIRGHKGA